MMTLNQSDVDHIPPSVARLIPTGAVSQLYIRTGKKAHSYVLVYKRAGVQRKLKIGDTRHTTLAQAVKLAKQELAKLTLGTDPAKERTAERRNASKATFALLVPQFIQSKRTGNRPRARSTLEDYQRYLGAYAKCLHNRPIDEIKRAEVAEAIEKVNRQRGPSVAALMARNLSSFFSWCERRGLIEHSPARNVQKPDAPAPRDRHLSSKEIGSVWNAVKDATDDWSRIVGLLLLTGARRNEIAELMWSEVDIDAGVINFDASRIKTRVAHKLPITNVMGRILAISERRNGFVFGQIEGRPFSGFSKAQARLLNQLSTMPKWTAHDLRRTFQTRMGDEGLAEERVLSSILNHAVQGVKRHYDYAQFMEQKRAALEAWGEYVAHCADEFELASKGQAA